MKTSLLLLALFISSIAVCSSSSATADANNEKFDEINNIIFDDSSTDPPVFPQQFEAEIHLSLPYAKLNEPITIWYDAASGSQRMDYYGGVSSYLYLANANASYQTYPTGSKLTCFTSGGPVSLQSIFPDMTNFTLQSDPVEINGVLCQNWLYIENDYGRANTYNMYFSMRTGQPVRYHMLGYDSLFGSHYDEYVVNYNYIIPGVNSRAFDIPLECNQVPESEVASFKAADPLLTEFSRMHRASELKQERDELFDNHFRQFAKTHNKKYSSQKEHVHRKNVFSHNMRFVNGHNRQKLSYSLKLNHLADLTSEERTARNNPMRPAHANNGAMSFHKPKHTKVTELPTTVDWRLKGAVTDVKDQGVCGSCWSFGAAQTIEGAIFMKTGVLPVLAEQALVDCSWPQGNNGCNGGLDYQGYQWIMSSGGLPKEVDYPYLMTNALCYYDNQTMNAVSLKGYVNVTSFDENALMDAVANVGPISISIDASQDSLSFYYTGVYDDQNCKNGIDDLDHTVLLVGYGSDATGGDYWIVKNSWSTHWGDQGYVKISRQNNRCGVATSPTYVVLN